ncbi:MAG: hypothetical protein ACKO54_18760, partial [Alphaproteobacteria bacterium]
MVDIAKTHFAALQKNILQCGRGVLISPLYGGLRCTFLDVSSLNLAVLSGTALFLPGLLAWGEEVPIHPRQAFNQAGHIAPERAKA